MRNDLEWCDRLGVGVGEGVALSKKENGKKCYSDSETEHGFNLARIRVKGARESTLLSAMWDLHLSPISTVLFSSCLL